MNAHLAGALGLAIVLGGAVITLQDFRSSVSRFWLSGGVNMFTFRRDAAPALVWASTLANGVLIGLVILGSVAALLLPTRS